jgi:hypothetical protein
MAISRNLRRQRAKVRQAIALTDAANTAAFVSKQAVIRGNCKTMGKQANRKGTDRIIWLDPTAKPVGFTRPLRWSKGVAK